MASVDDLKNSITEIPRKNAIDLLLDLRQARREWMERKKSKKKSSGGKKKSKKKISSIIEGMSAEDAQEMLNQLKEN